MKILRWMFTFLCVAVLMLFVNPGVQSHYTITLRAESESGAVLSSTNDIFLGKGLLYFERLSDLEKQRLFVFVKDPNEFLGDLKINAIHNLSNDIEITLLTPPPDETKFIMSERNSYSYLGYSMFEIDAKYVDHPIEVEIEALKCDVACVPDRFKGEIIWTVEKRFRSLTMANFQSV